MTTTPHKAPKGKATASAIQKPTAPAAPPLPAPEGWEQQTAFGFMRFDVTPAGRLVRLAEVLRWLESSEELPRAAALDRLCDAMPVDVLQWCYQLHQTEYAQPLPLDSMFGFQTLAQIETQKNGQRNAAMLSARRANWVTTWGDATPTYRVVAGRINTKAPAPTLPGLPALLRLIRQWWTVASCAEIQPAMF